MTTAVVRPMREADLEAFADITATSYYEVDTRTYQRAWPDPVRRPAARNGAWINRTSARRCAPTPAAAGWPRSTARSSAARCRGCAS